MSKRSESESSESTSYRMTGNYEDLKDLTRHDVNQTIYYPFLGDTKVKSFKPNKELLKGLLQEDEIENLKLYIRTVFGKICGYDYFKEEIVDLLTTYDSSLKVEESFNPVVLVAFLKRLMREQEEEISELETKLTEYIPDSAQGAGELAEVIAQNKEAVENMIDGLVKRVNDQVQELGIMSLHIVDLEKELIAKQAEVDYLRGEKLLDLSDLDEDFMDKMHKHLETSFPKHSSIIETDKLELKELQEMLDKFGDELRGANARLLELTSKRSLELENTEYLIQALTTKIKAISPDEGQVKQAVNEWYSVLLSLIMKDEEKSQELMDRRENLLEKIKAQRDELNKCRRELSDERRKVERIKDQIQVLDKEKGEALDRLTEAEDEIRSAEAEYEEKADRLRKMGYAIDSFIEQYVCDDSGSGGSGSRSPDKFIRDSPIIPATGRASPSISATGRASPVIPVSGRTSPSFRQSSPRDSRGYDSSDSSFSPFARDVSPSSPEESLRTQQTPVMVNPQLDGTFGMTPRAASTVDPSSQPGGRPYMGTVPLSSQGRSTPGQLVVLDQFTPRSYATPFISKSRFGYTDPTASVLNIPPGDDLDVQMSLKRTIVLPNPRKERPLLVDVEVQPRFLAETENEDRFLCNIVIGLQDSTTPLTTPTVTPGFSPSSTHGSVMRRVPYTPRGAKRDRYMDPRRLFRPTTPGHTMPWASPAVAGKELGKNITNVMSGTAENQGTSNISSDKSSQFNKTFGKLSGTREKSPPASGMCDKSPVMNRTINLPAQTNSRFRSPSPSSKGSASPKENLTFDKSSSRSLSPSLDHPSESLSFSLGSVAGRNRTSDRSSPRPRSQSPSSSGGSFPIGSPVGKNRDKKLKIFPASSPIFF